jgi:hypothetical protein
MFSPGDEVFVVADGSRHGQGGVVEEVLPGLGEQESYQVCIISILIRLGKGQRVLLRQGASRNRRCFEQSNFEKMLMYKERLRLRRP